VVTYVLACLVGLSLGLLGSGGSVLAVPILKYSAGLTAKGAVATSLATVGSVSFIGALLAWREGRVVWKEAILFSIVATLGTFGGVQLASSMSNKAQMGLFALVMAYAVVRMLKSEPAEPSGEKAKTGYVGSVFRALAVGVLTGVVGVGGGFLIVPALVALFHLPMKKATGTSLVIIAINSAVGTASYSHSVTLDWRFTATFVGCALVGLVIGMKVSKGLDDTKLKKVFTGLLVLVCLYTVFMEFF
jgi:uncharacterized protein